MVTPVSGPFYASKSRSAIQPNGGSYLEMVDEMSWYRQKKPFTLPLSFSHRRTEYLSKWDPNANYSWTQNPWVAITTEPASNEALSVQDKAYQKFVGAAKDACSAATSLAEGREAFGMILKRIGSLTSFARAVRKGHFGDAMDALDLARTASNKRKWVKAKGASSKWLEFHFGWSPLIGDIYDGAEVLTGTWRDGPVSASSSGRFRHVYPPPGDYSKGHVDDIRYRVRCAAVVRITNPNLYQLSQWGLTNPLEVAWELVPFSFVVDWFTNLGSMIGSMSDLQGITLADAYQSIHRVNTYSERWSGPNYPFSSFGGKGYGFHMTRTLGLSGPGFYVKPFVGFSVSRGATAIALLVGFMPKR